MITIEYKKEQDKEIRAKMTLIDRNMLQPKQKWIIFDNIYDIPVWFDKFLSWNYKINEN